MNFKVLPSQTILRFLNNKEFGTSALSRGFRYSVRTAASIDLPVSPAVALQAM